MCQHPACAAETRIRSKDCDVTIADCMGSRDAFPIPFPSFMDQLLGSDQLGDVIQHYSTFDVDAAYSGTPTHVHTHAQGRATEVLSLEN